MPLTAPFCTTQNQKLSLNRIQQGFGVLNNYNPFMKIVGAGTETGETFDVAVIESHVSLIRLFPEGQSARIRNIAASFWKVQASAGGSGSQTTTQHKIIARIVGLRRPPAQLERIVFDPVWDKNYPNYESASASLTGTNWENVTAWPSGGTGQVFDWTKADLFFDQFVTMEGTYNFPVNLDIPENDICALVLCPVYIDKAFHDTSTGLNRDMFVYAGGVGVATTDYRSHMVKRTFGVYGDAGEC